MYFIQLLNYVWLIAAAISGFIGVVEIIDKLIKHERIFTNKSVAALLIALLLCCSHYLANNDGNLQPEDVTCTNYPTEGATSTPSTVIPATTAVPEWFSDSLPYVPYRGITPECPVKDSIKWVQQTLRTLGYNRLAVDGDWGKQTSEALYSFEADYEYPIRDVVTYEMATHMLRLFVEMNAPLQYLSHYCP